MVCDEERLITILTRAMDGRDSRKCQKFELIVMVVILMTAWNNLLDISRRDQMTSAMTIVLAFSKNTNSNVFRN
uniref:Transposase n=1 Tax=Steinernema glaseri TaxID=37863 RepID=A0A1I8AHQ5_9BILA